MKGKNTSMGKTSNIGMNSACFKKRCLTVQRKAFELSTLCNTDVCVICYGPDGLLCTWPEDRKKSREIVIKFKGSDDKMKSKRMVNLAGFAKKSGGNRSKFPSWDKCLDGYSKDKLMELESYLVYKIQKMQERNELLKQEKEHEKKIQLVESCKQKELFYQLPHPATDNQNQNLSNLTRISFSDYEAWLYRCFLEEQGSSSNNSAMIPLQNQGFNYSDMNGNNNIFNVNNYCQSSVPQTNYQNLSTQVIGTSSSYNQFHPVNNCNNNVASMGNAENPYLNFQRLQNVNNNATGLNNGESEAGFSQLMVSNPLCQRIPALSWRQNQQSSGNPLFHQ